MYKLRIISMIIAVPLILSVAGYFVYLDIQRIEQKEKNKDNSRKTIDEKALGRKPSIDTGKNRYTKGISRKTNKKLSKTALHHLSLIKDGTFYDRQTTTIGNAFNTYFANPEWKYLEAKNKTKIVEFKGNRIEKAYVSGLPPRDKYKIKHKIQFAIHIDNKDFEIENWHIYPEDDVGFWLFEDGKRDEDNNPFIGLTNYAISKALDNVYSDIGGIYYEICRLAVDRRATGILPSM